MLHYVCNIVQYMANKPISKFWPALLELHSVPQALLSKSRVLISYFISKNGYAYF